MPNIWTHFLFGRELADRVGFQEASATPELLRIYQFGCQGPDFLFYHRFLPWQSGAGMPELGGAMHSRGCGPFLLDLLDAVRSKPLRSPEAVYALGFLTHHLLDRNAHPYVFYASGFKKWNHQRFEMIVDTLVARKLLGIGTWNTPVWKEIYVGDRLPGETALILDALARRHYPELAGRFGPDDWNDAYTDMIRAQKLFHDPTGLKTALTFGKIEPFRFKRRLPPIDYLNESKREWLHPSVAEEKHTESFWELWDQAMDDGMAVMSAALAYWADAAGDGAEAADRRSRLEACLGDRSYETGKPCAEGHRIVHVDPII
ncbi:zinc dependent phospholipase C family protein [Paenibacillus sp. GYB003]|uniref:zinc dependent phospholipase C family protein n=1 Tax=Paenibacillus sp. GYB003 TaxID=2994392 RepID=UPI002F963C47